MKIAIIGPTSNKGTRGVDACVKELTDNVTDQYKVTVFTAHKNKYKRMVDYFIFSCKAARYDTAHYHGVESALFSFIPRLAGAKVILTVHAVPQANPNRSLFHRTVVELSENVGVLTAHKIVAVAKWIEAYIWVKYRKNAVYIPNSIRRINENNS